MSIILVAGQIKKLDASLTPVVLPEDIRVFFINIYPPSCFVNDTVEIWISVKNYGATTGTKTVTCLVNNTPIGSKTVTVEEASAVYAKFPFTPTQAGTYTVSAEDKWAILIVLEIPVVPEVPQILIDYHSQYLAYLQAPYEDPESWAHRSKVYGAHSNYEITEAILAQSGRNMVVSLKGNYILSSDLPYGGDYPPTIYCAIRCYEKSLFEQYGKPDFTLPLCQGEYAICELGQPISGISAFSFGGTGVWKPSQPEGAGISGTVEFSPAGQFDDVIWHVPDTYKYQTYVNVCNLQQVGLPPGTYVITILVGIEVTERGGQWYIPEYYYQWKEITIPSFEPQHISYSEYIGHLGDTAWWNDMWARYCGR